MPEPPTATDLLGSLAALLARPSAGDGLTSQEISERTGLSIPRVREALRQAHRAGRLHATPVYRPSIDGKPRPTTIYRVEATS